MHSTRVWTIAANLPVDILKLLAAEALGSQPEVNDGVWSAVNGLGGNQPPKWMMQLSDRLAAKGIVHKLY